MHRKQHLDKPTLTFKNGRFIGEIPANFSDEEKSSRLNQLFKDWNITQDNKKIADRLKLYCPKMGLEPSKVVFKEQQKRWGTCTIEGTIYLNWRIMMSPMSVVDYVLVHELAHIKHPDHSSDYWRFVKSILTDYEPRKEWLRINGPTLTL